MITMPPIGEAARSKKRRANRDLVETSSDEAAARTGSSDEAIKFLCECRSSGCLTPVWLAGSHFRLLIEVSDFSLVAPGHADAGEHVVAASSGYQFVVPLDHVPLVGEALSGR